MPLSYAWENWDRPRTVGNKSGYLYRVGQSAARRYTTKAPPTVLSTPEGDDPAVTPTP